MSRTHPLNMKDLERIVAEDEKQRYTIGFLEDMIADCTQSMLDDPRLTGN